MLNIIGVSIAVAIPFKHMASPDVAPSNSPSSKARAVPIPCEAAPMASPKATLSWILNTFKIPGPIIAPKIPVHITNAAVSGGTPPIFSAMDIAIGVVTDFGAILATISFEAPNHLAVSAAERMPTILPIMIEKIIDLPLFLISYSWRYKGTPKATTDAGRKKLIICAPLK